MRVDRNTMMRYRQERVWLMGLCGVRFGHWGVCDEPAGHGPIAERAGWLHAETVNGVLGPWPGLLP